MQCLNVTEARTKQPFRKTVHPRKGFVSRAPHNF